MREQPGYRSRRRVIFFGRCLLSLHDDKTPRPSALKPRAHLPPAAQDDIARVVLRLAGTDNEISPVALACEERDAVAASKAAAARGEFATDEQVRAAWAKHGL